MANQGSRQDTRVSDEPRPTAQTQEERIRTLAYQYYCEAGCEHGHDLEHWLKAEQSVLGESDRNPRRAT